MGSLLLHYQLAGSLEQEGTVGVVTCFSAVDFNRGKELAGIGFQVQ